MFVRMFDTLVAAIDEVVAEGPTPAPHGDTVTELQRQRHRLDYALAVEVAAFDIDKVWSVDGAQNAAAWIRTTCHIPRRQAGQLLRLGRALPTMPKVAAAWAAGDIGIDHVDVLNAARRPATAEQFAADEDELLSHARQHTFAEFRRQVQIWDETHDPEHAESNAERRFAERRVNLSQSLDDEWYLDARLDPIGGTIFATELRRLDKKLFRKDWKEAKKRLGRKPLLHELSHTPTQRRADALVEMARRSGAMPKGARKPEPLLTVLCGYQGLQRMAELHNRTLVTPGSLVRWLSKAWIERVVFDSKSRPIDVGRHRRLFSEAQRRAIRARDRECTPEKCDVPADQCETDHIEPFAEGGPTTEANGRCHCRFHNQLRNKRQHPANAVNDAHESDIHHDACDDDSDDDRACECNCDAGSTCECDPDQECPTSGHDVAPRPIEPGACHDLTEPPTEAGPAP
jgi:hypothetical protein